ncbi:MAG TPA: alpha/beta fold hydrolase [Solirubrobacteraceae bacterium]|nr:alpha/beta fold hydrolase [Solirubrobacteraceae bacterium]
MDAEREAHRFAYGRNRAQYAVLELPLGEGPFAVVVLLHGGFWRMGFNRTLMNPLANDLLGRGLAVFNIEYRRLGIGWGGGGGWPQTFEDVAAGIDLLAELDAPLDLQRVVAVGHSAGGQLALWAAARAGLPDGSPGAGPRVPLAGAVGQAAVCDLRAAHAARAGNGVVRRLMGGSPKRVPERYDLASPVARLPIGVPVLLVHGERDNVVKPLQSIDYARSARAGGDEVTLIVRPREGHFEHLDPASGAWNDVVRWLGRQSA